MTYLPQQWHQHSTKDYHCNSPENSWSDLPRKTIKNLQHNKNPPT